MVVLASFTQPTDGIRHRQNNTTVYVNDNNLGKGTLYIAESRLSWVSDSGNGFSIEYPHISLHAISRDLSSFPQECLFLMLDTALADENEKNNDGEDENESQSDSSEQETTELRLVPDDRGMLDAMFHAMNACQALHPDPEDSFSDEDFYEDADDEVPMEETGSQMANLCIGGMARGGRVLGSKMLNGREVVWEGGRAVGRGVGMVAAAGSILDRSTSGAEEDMGVEEEEEEEDMGVEEEEDILDSTEEEEEAEAEGMGAEGMGAEDISDNTEEEEACMRVGMTRGGRAFALGNILRPGNLAEIRPELRHQTDPEEESNFADAEN